MCQHSVPYRVLAHYGTFTLVLLTKGLEHRVRKRASMCPGVILAQSRWFVRAPSSFEIKIYSNTYEVMKTICLNSVVLCLNHWKEKESTSLYMICMTCFESTPTLRCLK